MATVLSTDGILRNFTFEDFKQYGPGTSQPAAVLNTIAPTTVVHPAPNTTITLTGTGFKEGAYAKTATVNLATTFVSSTQLTAVIPAAQLLNAGASQITVVNPDAPASGSKTFTVT